MIMARKCSILAGLVLIIVVLVMECNAGGGSSLVNGFYRTSCPQAERIVRETTWKLALKNPALGAKLLRMHFHDCFVRGCDGSVLLDAIGGVAAEKDAVPNQSLSGFDEIDQIKTQIELACPNTVSCADILALAARDSVSFPFRASQWEVLTGRRDGTVSLASDTNGDIPSPFSGFADLLQIFTGKGLNANDLVVLSGAHTLGVARCGTFSNRLYNFTGNGDADPSLNPNYAASLKTKCPNPPPSPTTTVELDPLSSRSFDTHYYSNLLLNKGLLTSDATLLTDPNSAATVRRLLSSRFFSGQFAGSMVKMGAIGVLTGTDGQIRKNCRVVN